jgi:hypothetical protein
LREVGAFESGRPRWFRFPYLDRGPSADVRALLQREIEALGYRIAPVSVDWFDYLYDEVLSAPLSAPLGATDARYRRVVLENTRYVSSLAKLRFRRPVRHIAACHFGPATARNLSGILRELEQRGMRPGSLARSLGDTVYDAYREDFSLNGAPAAAWCPRPARAVLRRASRLIQRFEPAGRGPRFPYLG